MVRVSSLVGDLVSFPFSSCSWLEVTRLRGCGHGGFRCWWLVPEGGCGVGSWVADLASAFDWEPGLGEGGEDLAAWVAFPVLAVEALGVAVLPRAAQPGEGPAGTDAAKPCPHGPIGETWGALSARRCAGTTGGQSDSLC